MMITGEEHSGPDIWPKTPNHTTATEDIILTTWYKETMKQTKIDPQQHYLPGLNGKEAHYANYTSFYLKNNFAYPVTNT